MLEGARWSERSENAMAAPVENPHHRQLPMVTSVRVGGHPALKYRSPAPSASCRYRGSRNRSRQCRPVAAASPSGRHRRTACQAAALQVHLDPGAACNGVERMIGTKCEHLQFMSEPTGGVLWISSNDLAGEVPRTIGSEAAWQGWELRSREGSSIRGGLGNMQRLGVSVVETKWRATWRVASTR